MSAATTGANLGLCSWAACDSAATVPGEWPFCARHAAQDQAMQSGGEPDGEDIPDELLPPRALGHGTDARARMHRRDGEKPCDPCEAAERRLREDRRANMTTPPPQWPQRPTGAGVRA